MSATSCFTRRYKPLLRPSSHVRKTAGRWVLSLASTLALWLLIAPATANALVEILPKEGQKIDLGAHELVNENGEAVRLSAFKKEGRPLIIIPVFYGCPYVCSITLNDFFTAFKKAEYKAGEALEVVIFSFDPADTSKLAGEKKEAYLKRFNLPETGIHFLVGTKVASEALAADLGFAYERVGDQFVHASAVYLLTPEAVIAKVFKGTITNIKYFRSMVWQASGGKTISSYENFVRMCASLYQRAQEAAPAQAASASGSGLFDRVKRLLWRADPPAPAPSASTSRSAEVAVAPGAARLSN